MQIFNVGPLELVFILIIMILVLGPKGMVKGAHEFGKFIRKVTRSPLWKDVVDTSNEIRDLPSKIMREAGIEKEIQDLRRSTGSAFSPRNPHDFLNEEVNPLKTKKSELTSTETKPHQKSSLNNKGSKPLRRPDEKVNTSKKPAVKTKQ